MDLRGLLLREGEGRKGKAGKRKGAGEGRRKGEGKGKRGRRRRGKGEGIIVSEDCQLRTLDPPCIYKLQQLKCKYNNTGTLSAVNLQ